MSNNHIIEQILANADIVKIIGRHVDLKRSGNEYKGCCPFHGEKTPSFFVNPSKNVYNCFGCGVSGNALTFLKEYENMTAGEALQELSRQTGINLPKEPLQKNQTYQRRPILTQNQTIASPVVIQAPNPFLHDYSPTTNLQSPTLVEYPEYNQTYFDNVVISDPNYQPNWQNFQSTNMDNYQNASLYDLLNAVCQFYQQQLRNNPIAQNYFQQRGLTQETIETFALGYAPSGWQHLEQAFPQDIEGLKMLGLVRQSQKGNDFDLLRHRVIFPIRDNQGRVIAFAGRALSDDDQPKYINSSDSPVFHKQNVLYGLYEGRKAKAKDWLVVEGYMDVISLYQAGVYGAVASMGTAIATTQIERLLQLNPVLTLSFDGDNAGQKASWRAMEVGLPVLTDGKELRFLTLPNNHDPDSFVKAHGTLAMQQQIREAVTLSEYLFASLTRKYDTDSAENRTKILQELYQLTKKLPKGSYGWLLREDIKSRMGLGRKQQARQAQDTLLNFNGQLTPQRLLQLCFLYQPELLGEITYQNNQPQINQQLLFNLYKQSQLFRQLLPTKKQRQTRSISINFSQHQAFHHLAFYPYQTTKKPPFQYFTDNGRIALDVISDFYAKQLMSWQDFADEETLTLIFWIQQIQPQLYEFDMDNSLDDGERINSKAHFILAGLADTQRNFLMQHWIVFFNQLNQQFIHDISLLVAQIIAQLMIDKLGKQQKQLTTDLQKLSLCVKQKQIISHWQQYLR